MTVKETCKHEYPSEVGLAVIEQNVILMKQSGWKKTSTRTVMIIEFEREIPDPPASPLGNPFAPLEEDGELSHLSAPPVNKTNLPTRESVWKMLRSRKHSPTKIEAILDELKQMGVIFPSAQCPELDIHDCTLCELANCPYRVPDPND